MNPVYFVLTLSCLLGFNFLAGLILVLWAAAHNYYTTDEFFERLIILFSFISVIAGSFWGFFSHHEATDFSHPDSRVNWIYISLGLALCLFSCFFFLLGIWWDIANIVLVDKVTSNLYFLVYQIVIGGSLGRYLFGLFAYVEKVKFY